MASSNRHWPSMFKSKPCNSHHQWHHDINPSLTSTGFHRSPYASVSGCEERSPEPKPRWNPKPEQIRILEAIFNSGMVNPPRDEIRKIRAQLQEYGQVGDANVFYWFQNRKSRSKHKLRNLQNSKSQSHQTHPITSAPSSSSSSSSDQKSSPKGSNKTLSIGSINAIEISNSPTASVNQTYFQPHGEFMPETFYFPLQHTTSTDHYTQGFGFSELSNVVYVPDQQNVGPCTSLLLGEIMNHGALKKEQDQYKLKMQQQQLSYTVTNSTPINTSTNVTVPSTISDHIQGVGESCGVGIGGATRSTVFINDMAFEVAGGPLNVREAFGDDAVLINSAGQPVLTNEWGVTLHSLQHGAFYYLI